MKFEDLTPEEQKTFMEVAQSKIEDEVFMINGEDYFSLVEKGLVEEIPNANYLSASIVLTKKGKQMRDEILKNGTAK